MPDSLAFVDQIDSPTVRLNLTDGVTWGLRHGITKFDPPELTSTHSSSLLRDGDWVGASGYRNRRCILGLTLKAANADAVATALQNLARELDLDSNWLRWLPKGATNPVFFRTFRAGSGEWADELVDLKQATLDLEAEPFGRGSRQTLSTAVVNNDPAAGSNPMYFDIASPLGDVEAPLIMTITASDVIATGRRETLVATRRRGIPSNTPFLLSAETGTLGTNATLPGNDALMSGSSSNYVRVTPGTTAMSVRFSATHPGTAATDARGTYRVFARVRHNTGGDVWQARISASLDSIIQTWDTVTLPTGTGIRWIDLSGLRLLQLPFGPDPGQTEGGVDLPVRGLDFRFEAGRASGSGTLDVDCLAFVPADDSFGVLKWPANAGPTSLVADAARPQVYALGSGGDVRSVQLQVLTGGLPYISPGRSNRVFVIKDVGTGSTGDSKTGITTIVPSYYPRYVRVRPATT